MRGVALVVGVMALLAGPDHAAARAACFPAKAASPTGRVPTVGTLYASHEVQPQFARRDTDSLSLFDLGPLIEQPTPAPTVTWIGPEGTVTQTRLSPSMFRIDYKGPAGSTLVIGEDRYSLVDTWQSPPVPSVVKIDHMSGAWTCGGHDLVRFTLDHPPAAIRVRWISARHQEELVVIPRGQHDGVWTFELGSQSCLPTRLSPDELRLGGELHLFAIAGDGREDPVGGVARPFVGSRLFPDWTGNPKREEPSPVERMRLQALVKRMDGDERRRDLEEDESSRIPGVLAFALLLLAAALTRRAGRG